MRRLSAALLVVVAVLPAAAKDTAADEAKLRSQVAAEIAKASAACAAAGSKTEAVRLAAEAAALDGDAPGVSDAHSKADAMDADGDGAPAAAAKALASQRPAVAKLYDKLAALGHEAKDDARFDDYALRAFAWEPKPRAGKLLKEASAALGSKEPWRGARLLARMRKADPDNAKKGAYDANEVDLAKSSKLMLASAVNGYVVWASLPGDWKRSGKWPVLVGCEGSGCNFEGYFRASVAARGSRGVIVLTPVSMSSTNADKLTTSTFPMYDAEFVAACRNDVGKRLAFEGTGLDSILDDLRARWGADDRCFHTGFSGGGIFTYWRTFQAPERVRGTVPCCGNFSSGLSQGGPGAGEGGGPPVHILTGEKDPHRDFTFGNRDSPGIEPQSDAAVQAFEAGGFTRVRRTLLPGVGHSALHAQAWEFVDEVLSGRAPKK